MSRLRDNSHWRMLSRPVIGGAWLIGPELRNIIAAALEDAMEARYPGDCADCPAPSDITDAAEMGVEIGRCHDHTLDLEMTVAYELAAALLHVEPDSSTLRAELEQAMARVDGRDG